jgi:hypothetical protein
LVGGLPDAVDRNRHRVDRFMRPMPTDVPQPIDARRAAEMPKSTLCPEADYSALPTIASR